MPSLTITPTPYRSSRLAIPPSPFSPRLPLSPPPQIPTLKPTKPQHKVDLATPAPPPSPLHWLWQCHICSRIYHLGVTRRCLDDGHFFCAGAPVLKRNRATGQMVRKKGRACASEFDYAGWKAWGNWRRDVEQQREIAQALVAFNDKDQNVGVVPRPLFAATQPLTLPKSQEFGGAWTKPALTKPAHPKKDCWRTCDYPSECRWGKQYGAQQSQAQTDASTASAAAEANMAAANTEGATPKTKFEDILVSIPATIEEGSENESSCKPQSPVPDEAIKKPTFEDVLESAKRRKRRSASTPPSPLASHPVVDEPTVEVVAVTIEGAQNEAAEKSLQRAFDDFELDVRKSFGKASELLGGLVPRWKEERADSKREKKRKGRRADDIETRSLSE